MVGTDAHGVNGAPAMTDRPRIGDVARHAGVSVGTVSNAFNRPDLVADATLRRIEEAVDSLNYVRNESARQLRSGQSRTIGLIVPDVANPFFTDVARGVEDVTSAAGVLVIVCNSDSGVEKEQRYLRMLAEHQVLGILHVPAGQNGAPVRGRDRRVPLVMLDHTGPARGSLLGGGRRRERRAAGGRPPAGDRPPADRLRRMCRRVAEPGDRPARRRPRGDGATPGAARPICSSFRPPRSPSRAASRRGGRWSTCRRAVARRRSRASTTCWRSGSCSRCCGPGCGCPKTSPSSATTTSPSPGGGRAAHVGAPAAQPPRPPRRRAAPRRDEQSEAPPHQRGVRARADRARVEPLTTRRHLVTLRLIGDLVTQFSKSRTWVTTSARSVSRPAARRGCRRDRGGTTGGGRRPPWDRSPRCPWHAAR